jgi:DNA-binding MarR family transcriptional regulator
MSRTRVTKPDSDATADLGFLLSQVGAHAAALFRQRLAPLELAPPHVGILGMIRQTDGMSQQELGHKLGVFPSRLVGLLDELEQRGLVERRDSPSDRRSYALFLTRAGRDALGKIGQVAREHQDAFCAALDESERARLADLLRRIAHEQGLTPGVHPGYRRLGGPETKHSDGC